MRTRLVAKRFQLETRFGHGMEIDSTYTITDRQHTVLPPPKIALPYLPSQFSVPMSRVVVESHVHLFHQAEVWRKGCVFNRRGRLVWSTRRVGPLCHAHRLLFEPIYHLPQVGVVLTQHSINYSTWLLDILPRIFLLNAFKTAKHLVLYLPRVPYHYLALLRLCHIAPHQVLFSDTIPRVQAQNIFVAGNLLQSSAESVCCAPWAIQWLRLCRASIFSTPYKRKLYCRSEDAPTIVNEQEMISLLQQQNFEIVDLTYCSFDEQQRLFASASVVICATHTSLVDVIFCQKETVIIELIRAQTPWQYVWQLCALLELTYCCLVSVSEGEGMVIRPFDIKVMLNYLGLWNEKLVKE